ncbi:alkylglycerol monooxygenase isoform X2 [Cyprinus carpio]|uniref:Alkylglycerol monooxygenase n=1 Tax=Cyprinus carpio TaxID=7962 RepID=A0A9Q9X5S1_CYPCA|nr:alkylglycerol monooxygenase isoform X1 [Cyprinus carpio]XP_042595767.1 alkylglycerol monooxygenase isoform X2 [Cyprinus carpio]
MAQVEVNNVTVSQGVRMLFSLMTPNESSFATVQEVPTYVSQATPYFTGLILLEIVLGWLKTDGPRIKINDFITSLSAGMMSRLPQLMMRSLELSSYIYVWNNFRLLELPWDSAWTWWLAFFGVDMGYYWFHRFAHEFNILWAAHQVHHSSEYYNLSTALRQSVTVQFSSWAFYLPLALAVPPSVFAVHIQLNLLYQFWIHTELVKDLGPLEWILNTPSHHRVHHGRNPYCIDKNYAGILIIWDRMFGTFAPESDQVVYGLTYPISTFEIWTVEFLYYPYLWQRFWEAEGISNKLSVIFKGPGWTPGKPRLGDIADIPQITGEEMPHNPTWSPAMQAYVLVQFFLLLDVYNNLLMDQMILSEMTVLLLTAYVLLSLTSLGFLIDQRANAAEMEMLRCVLIMALQRFGYIKPLVPLLAFPIEAFVLISAVYWSLQCVNQRINRMKKQN